MNNEQRSSQGRPTGDRSTSGSPITASAGQVARSRGLTWVKALTLGAGAAGAVGAAAIAATLPGSATTASVQIAPAASTSGTPSDDDRATSESFEANGRSDDEREYDERDSDDEQDSDDASEDGSRSEQQRQPAAPQQQRQPAAPQQQLQPAAPPGNSNTPPNATSGGS